MFAVFGLLNFDAPHAFHLSLASFHSFENSSSLLAYPPSDQLFPAALYRDGIRLFAFEKIQVTFRIIARPTDSLTNADVPTVFTLRT